MIKVDSLQRHGVSMKLSDSPRRSERLGLGLLGGEVDGYEVLQSRQHPLHLGQQRPWTIGKGISWDR